MTRSRTIALAVAASGVLAVSAAAAVRETFTSSADSSPAVVSPQIQRPTRALSRRALERQAAARSASLPLLEQIANGYGGTPVTAATLVSRPRDFRCSDDETPNAACDSGLWARLTIPLQGTSREDVLRAQWYAELIGGALRDEQRAAGITPIYQVMLDATLPNDSTTPTNAGLGDSPGVTAFADPTDASLRTEINDGATKAGLVVKSISFVHADTVAPDVTVSTNDSPTAFASNYRQVLETLLSETGNLEGAFVEVDANSTPLYVESNADRGGVGTTWWSQPELNPRPPPAPAAR